MQKDFFSPTFLMIVQGRFFRKIIIIFFAFLAPVITLLGQWFQKFFIESLTQLQKKDLSSILLLLLTTGCMLIGHAFNLLAQYLGAKESAFFQKKAAKELYKKILTLPQTVLQTKEIGEWIAAYSNDISTSAIYLEQILPSGLSIFFPFFLTPLFLHFLFHLPLFSLYLFIGFVFLLYFFLAKKQAEYFFRYKLLTADRITSVHEWIYYLKSLRILGWVAAFEKILFQKKHQETLNRIEIIQNGQLMHALASCISFLLNLLAIGILLYFRAQDCTASNLLALLWILGVFLSKPFRQLPTFLVFSFDAWTSVKRLDAFFRLSYQPPKIDSDSSSSYALSVENLSWRVGEKQILNNISFEIEKGSLIALTGPVGAGKTALLLSLCQQTQAHWQKYHIGYTPLERVFAFITQESFILNGTLGQNVINSLEEIQSADTILAALQEANFELEKENIPDGLNTLLGDKGIHLSGGQKQRVNIARAIFSAHPILLLDDCFRGLDQHTEAWLIENLLVKKWKQKTKIIATHKLDILKKSDQIFFLEEGGICAKGKFTDLLKNSSQFKNFIGSQNV